MRARSRASTASLFCGAAAIARSLVAWGGARRGRCVHPDYVYNGVGTQPIRTYDELKQHPAVVTCSSRMSAFSQLLAQNLAQHQSEGLLSRRLDRLLRRSAGEGVTATNTTGHRPVDAIESEPQAGGKTRPAPMSDRHGIRTALHAPHLLH